MTLLGYIKGILIVGGLFGAVFLGIGAWKAWSAYNFSEIAEKREGTFKGYHTVYHEETHRDPDGYTYTSRSRESLPMFSYTDEKGQIQDASETEGHFFMHLKVGQKVEVLIPPEHAVSPRLGDWFSLYGNGILNGLVGTVLIFLAYYGIKGSDALLGPEKLLHRLGQSRLPLGDTAIVICGFLALAGVTMFLAYRYTIKRQDPSLINALDIQHYQDALRFASDGRGIDAETPSGETTLIAALKLGQTELARAILRCLWVNGNVYTADGISAAQLAANLRDPQTLALLIKKGALTHDIDPSVVHDLIIDGETETVRLIIENGYDLHQIYKQRTFGDLALIHGRVEIVQMIHTRQGLFHAPAAFVALARNDRKAFAACLQQKGASNQRFNNFTLEQYAEKIGQTAMISNFK